MCVAIIKPAGTPLPSWEIFETCFESNPDGAGFAYSTGKNFIIRKGLQSFEAFKAAVLVRITAKGPAWALSTPMAFHFRIGTHGSQDDPKHTHPFPLTDKLESLESLHIQCKQIVMHNGILSSWGTSHYAKKDAAKTDLSDTMDFIQNYVSVLAKAIAPGSLTTNKHACKLIGTEVSGSRFVIMDPNGAFAAWGDWIEHEGCYYSNGGFEYRKPVYSSVSAAYQKAYGYSDWDDVGDFSYENARSWPKLTDTREYSTSTQTPETPETPLKLPVSVPDYRRLEDKNGTLDFRTLCGADQSRKSLIAIAVQLGLSVASPGDMLVYAKGNKYWRIPDSDLYFRANGELYVWDGCYPCLYFEMAYERYVPEAQTTKEMEIACV